MLKKKPQAEIKTQAGRFISSVFFKRILFKILGPKLYLKTISNLFSLTYRLNLLKGKTAFDYHYFVKKIIKKGDTVIDLGANLGYYSRIFSHLVGSNGTVYCVEPVELYRSILKRNCRNCRNLVILPYAIGANDNEKVKMGIPVTHGYFSHGRTCVLKENEKCLMTFNATVKTPGSLFPDLKNLDYLKCDIEGYERIAIPLFQDILRKFNPVLQIEIAKQNREQLVSFLNGMNYITGEVRGEKICLLSNSTIDSSGDFIFIPKDKLSKYSHLIDNMTISSEADSISANKKPQRKMTKSFMSIIIMMFGILLAGCNDSVTGDRIDLASLQRRFQKTTSPKLEEKIVSNRVPQSRDELTSMRTVVKVYNGAYDAGLTVPGFGGVKLGKSETNLNVYYVETKMVKTGTDTAVYGIGYSTHYLFKKLKRGIDASNLASVAASAQLQSNKTSVYYSLQTLRGSACVAIRTMTEATAGRRKG